MLTEEQIDLLNNVINKISTLNAGKIAEDWVEKSYEGAAKNLGVILAGMLVVKLFNGRRIPPLVDFTAKAIGGALLTVPAKHLQQSLNFLDPIKKEFAPLVQAVAGFITSGELLNCAKSLGISYDEKSDIAHANKYEIDPKVVLGVTLVVCAAACYIYGRKREVPFGGVDTKANINTSHDVTAIPMQDDPSPIHEQVVHNININFPLESFIKCSNKEIHIDLGMLIQSVNTLKPNKAKLLEKKALSLLNNLAGEINPPKYDKKKGSSQTQSGVRIEGINKFSIKKNMTRTPKKKVRSTSTKAQHDGKEDHSKDDNKQKPWKDKVLNYTVATDILKK